MRMRANEVDYTQIVVKGIPSLFTETRVVRDFVPEGFYLYEVRCDDDGLGNPSQIGSCVIVNFLGTLLASEKLELPGSGYLDIDPESDWAYGVFIGSLKDGIRSVRQMVFRNTLCGAR